MTKSPARVLHVITGLAIGGAERALYNLLAGGLEKWFHNEVVSLTDEGTFGARIRALGVPVRALGMRPARPAAAAVVALRRIVQEFRPDVIQGWMYHGNLAATVAARTGFRKPNLVWGVHHSLDGLAEERGSTRWVIRGNGWLSRCPGVIIYCSHRSRAQHEAFGYAAGSGQIIPNGFCLQKLEPRSENRRAILGKLGIPKSSVVIGHVARFYPVKRHDAFLRAAARLAREYENLHFMMIGRGVTADNPALEALVPGVPSDHLHMLGECEDVERLMGAMDIFCQSSCSEAFPNVIGEAMACGVPCVVTDVGDSGRIVGDTGVIVPPDDDAALTEGIREVIELGAKKRTALGWAARQRIEQNYSLDAVITQYRQLYEELIAGRC